MVKPLASPLKTQLNANFGLGSQGKTVVIEPDPSLYIDFNIHLLMYPEVVTAYTCDVGILNIVGSKVVDVPAGSLTFSGGDTVQLPKPPSEIPEDFLRVLFAFNSQGQNLGGQVGVFYDFDTNTVRASQACYAAVTYKSYKSQAAMLEYEPVLESYSGGVKVTYGVVAAFLAPSSVAVYQTQPSSVEDGNIEIELYRRVSYNVTTPEGEFELPPNYPNDGIYPSSSFVLDVTTAMKTQRAHEIGYMDLLGRARVANFMVPLKAPYVGSLTYTPKIETVLGTIPNATPKGEPISQDFINKAKNFIRSKGYGQGL